MNVPNSLGKNGKHCFQIDAQTPFDQLAGSDRNRFQFGDLLFEFKGTLDDETALPFPHFGLIPKIRISHHSRRFPYLRLLMGRRYSVPCLLDSLSRTFHRPVCS